MITGRDDEFRATVTYFYRLELGRDPDPSGMDTFVGLARQGWTGPQIQQALHDSPEGVAYRARPKPPPPPPVPPLDFTSLFVGTDQFRAYRQYLDGQDLGPLFAESRELGFNLWRVFLQGSQAQNGILELRPDGPVYYERLRPFVQLLNDHGIVPLATVFVDNQDIRADLGHWMRVADALRGSGTLLSGGNEFPKNGYDPGALPDPGMPWSRGSNLSDQTPPAPYATFAEFHPRRDWPKTEMDAVASPLFLREEHSPRLTVPLIIDEPIGAAEATIPGKRSADAALWWRLGRLYATECAGAVFHNDAGMRGQLMGPVTRACAEAFVRGMRR